MRDRLAAAKPARGVWETKNGPGRLMDVELLAQMMALITGSAARGMAAGGKGGILSDSEQTVLVDAYRLLWRLQAGTRLITDRALDMDSLGEGARAFLLRETAETDAEALSDRLDQVTGLAEAVIARHVTVAQGA